MSAFKFHLRDLFWVAIVLALALGWRLDRTRRQERLTQIETQLANTVDAYLLLFELQREQSRVYVGSEPMSPEEVQRIKAILEQTSAERRYEEQMGPPCG